MMTVFTGKPSGTNRVKAFVDVVVKADVGNALDQEGMILLSKLSPDVKLVIAPTPAPRKF